MGMKSESNLSILLQSMEPEIDAEEYIFCSSAVCVQKSAASDVWAVITEAEGKTFILKKKNADENEIPYESVFKKITLNVYSSLTAVGLTAAVASALASYGISANVVAGYYHDHIFVQSEKSASAVKCLKELAASEASVSAAKQ
ncbi:MAG: ACT domain-containing protein [Treponema sp.]|nr:ACT domain-containing protein [Treponema sp.]